MKANGAQLEKIAELIDAGHIYSVIDRIYHILFQKSPNSEQAFTNNFCFFLIKNIIVHRFSYKKFSTPYTFAYNIKSKSRCYI